MNATDGGAGRREQDEYRLRALVESMVRAGYSEREIERAVRRGFE
ncbi:MAG TPA: hypothetical protein VN770_07265 [Gaiellaceae bacterium]|nr:hypothetical protein [Gaiellaceae bacterium]